jgi:hypothetical protein
MSSLGSTSPSASRALYDTSRRHTALLLSRQRHRRRADGRRSFLHERCCHGWRRGHFVAAPKATSLSALVASCPRCSPSPLHPSPSLYYRRRPVPLPVSVWLPFAAWSFHCIVYGLLDTSAPKFAPSSLNCTPDAHVVARGRRHGTVVPDTTSRRWLALLGYRRHCRVCTDRWKNLTGYNDHRLAPSR